MLLDSRCLQPTIHILSRHALMDVQLFIVSFTSLTIVNLLLIHTYTSLIINCNDLNFMSTYNHLLLYYVMFPFKIMSIFSLRPN